MNEMIKDIAEAILRLNQTLAKHGYSAATEITLGNLDDFHRMRSMRPDNMFMAQDMTATMDRDVAAKICGVAMKAPAS